VPATRLPRVLRAVAYPALAALYLAAALIVLPSRNRLPHQLAAGADSAVRVATAVRSDSATSGLEASSSALPMLPAANWDLATPVPPPLPPLPDSAALEHAALTRFKDAPLARLLRRRNPEPEMAGRMARAILVEAKRLKVAPSLLAAVLLIENPRLQAEAVSSQGAMGLMQVMPFHAGEFGCASVDLLEVEANICHGARVFGRYLKRAATIEGALLRYNGCVKSINTPNCQRYPAKVLRAQGKVRHELIRYAAITPSDSARQR
jgi:soluble lytic murein transglycosylase-like protein